MRSYTDTHRRHLASYLAVRALGGTPCLPQLHVPRKLQVLRRSIVALKGYTHANAAYTGDKKYTQVMHAYAASSEVMSSGDAGLLMPDLSRATRL
jgi:hypothetical protein